MTRTIQFTNWSTHHSKLWRLTEGEDFGLIYFGCEAGTMVTEQSISLLTVHEVIALRSVLRKVIRNHAKESKCQ